MTKISLLCPTRGRPKHTKALITSIENTVSDINNIELLIAYDTDDETTKKELNSIPTLNKPYRFFSRERSEWLNKDYYNWLAEKACGDYLFVIGDDVRFLSKDWDKVLIDRVEVYLKTKQDRIAYITVEDGTEASHCCFPIVTKEAFKVLKMVLHPQLMSWGADRTIHEIYGNRDIMRELNISEIKLDHLSYHDGKAPFDETARSVKERFFRDPECHNKVSIYIVPQQIKILEKYIKEFQPNGMVGEE
jgi:hypothetical protein